MIFKELLSVFLIIIVCNFNCKGNATDQTEIFDFNGNYQNQIQHILIRRSSSSNRSKHGKRKEVEGSSKRSKSKSKTNTKIEFKSCDTLKEAGKKFTPKFDGRPDLYDDIDKGVDFTCPLLIGQGIFDCTLDYSVEEIMAPGNTLSELNMVFMRTHQISPCVDKRLKYGENLLTDWKYNSNTNFIIMPIYRRNNYTLVLIADMKNRELIYYDPTDPSLSKKETLLESSEIFKGFLEFMRTHSDANLNLNVWKCVPAEGLQWSKGKLPEGLEPPGKYEFPDSGIYAAQFIHFFIDNIAKKRFAFSEPIDQYEAEMRQEIVDKTWYYYRLYRQQGK